MVEGFEEIKIVGLDKENCIPDDYCNISAQAAFTLVIQLSAEPTKEWSRIFQEVLKKQISLNTEIGTVIENNKLTIYHAPLHTMFIYLNRVIEETNKIYSKSKGLIVDILNELEKGLTTDGSEAIDKIMANLSDAGKRL